MMLTLLERFSSSDRNSDNGQEAKTHASRRGLAGRIPGPAAYVGGRPGQGLRPAPHTRIERIASEQTGITADTALRLAKALGTTAQLWLNLQNDYDIQIAKRDLGKVLERIETVNKPRAA